jgi:uncharacterized protein (TIGR03032 family)
MGKLAQQSPERLDIGCSHSDNFPDLLAQRRISLLISTYHTGHLVVVSAHQGQLTLAFHLFERAMGVSYKPGCISICTGKEVWFARNCPDIAAKIEPRGRHDACFLARTAHFTGDIHAHESAWVGNELWIVNTLFSCLCALHPYYSFAPRWRPPFITALKPEDRCHLNGMAMVDGRPKYVTALAETDTAEGWRKVMATSGCIIEVPTGRFLARGLSVPHSPRFQNGRLFFLNSGEGRLEVIDPCTGRRDSIADLQGVSRGLALHEELAFVGLSKARPTLKDVPIVERREQLKCGVAVVDLKTGSHVANLDFCTGVEEVFDVVVLPGVAAPFVSGPWGDRDTGQPFWTVPPG